MPKVSITLPCYNEVQFMEKAFQLVLGKTYTCWVCIVMEVVMLQKKIVDESFEKYSSFENIKVKSMGFV